MGLILHNALIYGGEKCPHKLLAMVVKNSFKLVADRFSVLFVVFDFLGWI